jgi:hypothetical protein
MDSLCVFDRVSAQRSTRGGDAMRKMTHAEKHDHLRYDWKGELLAVFLAVLIFGPVVLEWFYWTRSQLGR